MQLRFRLISVLIGGIILAVPALAQIPNAGFESWNGDEPVGWTTNNDTSASLVFITPSTSSHNGTYAAMGTVIAAPIVGIGIPPNLIGRFAISQRPGSLHGFLKYSPVGGDRFWCTLVTSTGSNPNGGGVYIDSLTRSTYQEFIIPINYTDQNTPDSIIISFETLPGGSQWHVGSTFWLDDLSFGPATGVNGDRDGRPSSFHLFQNYPNPFNPATGIVYDIAEQSHVTVTVYNLLGQQVAVLVNERQPAGRYKTVFDGAGVSSGMYFYTIRTEHWSATGKMLLAK